MAAAARIHIVEKGKDPRAYAMVGFGGAGPAHAAGVARVLGVREVLIPPASGAASALGFLAAPLSFEQVRSHPVRLLDAPGAAATHRCDTLELRSAPHAARARHADEADVRDRTPGRHAPGRPDARDQRGAAGRPHHRCDDARDPRGVRHRLRRALYVRVCRRRRHGGLVPRALPRPAAAAFADRGRRAIRRRGARRARRAAWFDGGFVDTPVYDRYALAPGDAHRRPGDHRGARGHHHHRRPATRVTVDATGTLAHRHRPVPPRRPRASPPTRRSNRPPR